MLLKALSHIVIASNNVKTQAELFKQLFKLDYHFFNEDFCDFVLPDKRRIAFFKPIGKAAQFFDVLENSSQVSLGLTVDNVDQIYEKVLKLQNQYQLEVSGPPKEHPWGEKSFLLIDSDRNRWEITQSPSEEGHLVNIEF